MLLCHSWRRCQNDSDNNLKASESDETPGVDNAEKKQSVNLPDPSKLTSCSRDDITTFVKKLCKTDDCHLKEIDILKSKHTSKLVSRWLLLKKNLQVQNRLNSFACFGQAKRKKEIRVEYNKKKETSMTHG